MKTISIRRVRQTKIFEYAFENIRVIIMLNIERSDYNIILYYYIKYTYRKQAWIQGKRVKWL
jgi:hypothetical protein